MTEREFGTSEGFIRYMTSDILPDRKSLVFLYASPEEEQLFRGQMMDFQEGFNVLGLDVRECFLSVGFSLEKAARFLHRLLFVMKVVRPVLVGLRVGGVVAQSFMQYFPGEAGGFVGIGAVPLNKKYYPSWKILMMGLLPGSERRCFAQAVGLGLPYRIDCFSMLLCGEMDDARGLIRRWAEEEGCPLVWIPNGGHVPSVEQGGFVSSAILAVSAGVKV